MPSRPKKRTVLITGVCGCIGSHLLDELLRRGERVIGVDDLSFGKAENIAHHLRNENFTFHRLDVCDLKALSRKAGRADVIVHLATVKKIGERQPALPTLMVNAMGADAVLRFARRAGVRKTVIASTSDVYGVSTKLPLSEDGPCVIGAPTAKRWAYAVSKLFIEQMALSYHKDFGVPVAVLRYFGVFSERANTGWSGGHIPLFIDSILRGKEVVVHGDGRQTRSMGYVSDAVRGTLLAMDSPKAAGEIINIGNDEEMSVLDAAKLIHRLSGTRKPLKIKFVPMKKVFGAYQEIARRVPDLSKARRLLGYRPQASLKRGLERVLAYRKGHRLAVRKL